MSASALSDCGPLSVSDAGQSLYDAHLSTDLRLENGRRIAGERHLDQASRQARLEERLLVLTPAATARAADEHPHDRDDESGVDDFLFGPRLEGKSGERLRRQGVRTREEEERREHRDAGRFAEVVLPRNRRVSHACS